VHGGAAFMIHARERVARAAPNGCLIGAPWLVHGEHGASLSGRCVRRYFSFQQLLAVWEGARRHQRASEAHALACPAMP
jgi:hypothetical protein